MCSLKPEAVAESLDPTRYTLHATRSLDTTRYTLHATRYTLNAKPNRLVGGVAQRLNPFGVRRWV